MRACGENRTAVSFVCKWTCWYYWRVIKKFFDFFQRYNFALELPHLPDMVFHKNILVISHKTGARLEFNPIDALKLVRNEKLDLKVACSDEWRESRQPADTQEKVKPFDWTFTTEYRGTVNEKFAVETTDQKIDMAKLMKREPIYFYHDLTLFEDELHDHGISVLSVKVVCIDVKFGC